ncbi:hypothetical protein HS125_01585 [bacterium]|nr:hypothetical protein [bacterium]
MKTAEQDDPGAGSRQLLAGIAFLLSLFSLFCTLFMVVVLWGAIYAPEETRTILAQQLGTAPFDRYAGLLALKMAAGLASLFGIALWNSRGAGKLRLFRALLFGDIAAGLALLAFARMYDEVGPIGYFKMLTYVSVGLILVWAGAGLWSGAKRRPSSAGGS